MNFTKLVPNVFYTDINDGIKLFVNCLEFTIEHEEIKSAHPFCVLEKDGLRINLFQDEQLAKEHYPEFRLVTNDIEEVYAKISASHSHLLHPNLDRVTLRPWGKRICDKRQPGRNNFPAVVGNFNRNKEQRPISISFAI